MLLRNGRYQNPLVDAAGAVRILEAVLRNGRFRVDGDGDDGGLVGGSTAGCSGSRRTGCLLGLLRSCAPAWLQCCPVTVTTGAFVEGVAVCGTGGGHYGCGIVVGVIGAGSAQLGADVYHGCIGGGLLVIVAQGGGFVCLVAVPAGALVEGVALFGTGGGLPQWFHSGVPSPTHRSGGSPVSPSAGRSDRRRR